MLRAECENFEYLAFMTCPNSPGLPVVKQLFLDIVTSVSLVSAPVRAPFSTTHIKHSMAVTRQTSTSLIAFSPDQKMLDRENWEDEHLLNIVITVVRSLHYHTKY